MEVTNFLGISVIKFKSFFKEIPGLFQMLFCPHSEKVVVALSMLRTDDQAHRRSLCRRSHRKYPLRGNLGGTLTEKDKHQLIKSILKIDNDVKSPFFGFTLTGKQKGHIVLLALMSGCI